MTEDRSDPASAGSAELLFSIAAVERATGLSKDSLRAWEKRYGFPKPQRDRHGDRAYDAAQLQRLQLLKQLLDVGHRPGKLVPLPATELQRLLSSAARSSVLTTDSRLVAETSISACLQLLHAHDAEGLRQRLDVLRVELGLAAFVQDLVAPLTRRVGEAWQCGDLDVHHERLYTATVSATLAVVTRALVSAQPTTPPRMLITTVPGEPHGLGLLMVQATLALERVECISLGVQTPLDCIVHAVQGHRPDIVGLSFSSWPAAPVVLPALEHLRRELPATVQLWAGGSSPVLQRRAIPGVRVIASLGELGVALRAWREAHAP